MLDPEWNADDADFALPKRFATARQADRHGYVTLENSDFLPQGLAKFDLR